MTQRPLHRDPATGRIMLPGRVHKVLTEPFITATAVPSWLTTGGSGTVTVANASAGRGEMSFAATGNGATASVTGPQIHLPSVEAILWEVEGVRLSGGALFSMALAGSTSGAYVIANSSTAKMSVRGPGITSADRNWQMGARAVNVGLLLDVQRKHLYCLEGDQVMVDADLSAQLDVSAAVAPSVTVAVDGSSAGMKVAQLRLTVCEF